MNKNSKKNFSKETETQEININEIHSNPDLKEPDKDLLNLISDSQDWYINKETSKVIISRCIAYLDALLSLRFDISPKEDKKLVHNMMSMIMNATNSFLNKEAETYPVQEIATEQKTDDIYASFVVQHGTELLQALFATSYERIGKYDIVYVQRVLDMVIDKTEQLLVEAE